MRVIYKYQFDVTGNLAILLPKGAEILSIQCQGGQPCLWALVDTDQSKEAQEFRIVGTGQPLFRSVERNKYITTFQHGQFVWHVFRA
jgi:hypothetical protein